MFAWIPYAFVRFVLFFAAGILTGIAFPDLFTTREAVFATLSTSAIFFLLARTKWTNPGYAALVALFFAGWLNVLIHTETNRKNHLKNLHDEVVRFSVVITSPEEEKENTRKHAAELQFIHNGREWKNASGKILIYFKKSSFPLPFKYGDRLILEGNPKPINPPMNPGEFDYKKFLGFRNIYHQHFVSRKNEVVYIGNSPPNLILATAYRIRSAAKEILNEHLPEPHQRAVAYALLLGVTDALDNELTHAYAAAGAMHVLAVSGLHVGILYGLLLLVFKPLTATRKGKWILAIMSILLLWFYAIFTGLSPSVLRAVTMFSFIVLARPMAYRTNIYNMLAASAFILLAFNPFLIMSVGFQLSYMAVLSIVYLYPLLYHSWDVPGWAGDKIWQITCVSVAAQVGTFVLGLLYFHQFPTYFLVSNLFVIPGATLILINGILLFISSGLPYVSEIFGFTLKAEIDGLNLVVKTVENLPFSLIEPVYISTPQSWLLLGMVISFIFLLHWKKPVWAAVLCCCAVVFGVIQWSRFYNWVKPARLTVYHIPGQRALEITTSGHSFFYADSALLSDAERISYSIRPNRLQAGVLVTREHNLTNLMRNHEWIILSYKEIKILYLLGQAASLPSGFFDFVIIGKSTTDDLRLPENLSFGKIILDCTLQGKVLEDFESTSPLRDMATHAVARQGAFQVEL